MKRKTNEEFIREAKTVHGNKYDYSKVDYTSVFGKVTIICPIHGEFQQIAHDHLRGYGCSKCAHEKLGKAKNEKSKAVFIEKAIERTGGKYDFSQAEYVNAKTKIEVLCHKKDNDGNEHGPFYITPSNLLSLYGCPKCGKEANSLKGRIPFEEYQARVDEKYGDGVYTVDKNSYETDPYKITVHCNVHGTDFSVTTKEFPRHTICRCKDCVEDLNLVEKELEAEEKTTFKHPKMNDDIRERVLSGEEVWVPVRGAQNYIVSSCGRIKKVNRVSRFGNALPDITISTFERCRMVSAWVGGRTRSVHKIVFESFYGIDIPKGYQYTIDHIDTDFRNNSVLNLRLCAGIRDNMMQNPLTRMHLRKENKNRGNSLLFDINEIEGEIWAPCRGYEGLYSVSNIGRVKAEARHLKERNTGVIRTKRPHLMKQFLKDERSFTVGLVDAKGQHRNHFVHRLVYEAFISEIPPGFEIDHLDSNPQNNVLSNLRLCSHAENMRNPNSLKKRVPHKARGVAVGLIDKDGKVVKVFQSIRDCAGYLNIHQTSAGRIINGDSTGKKTLKNGERLVRMN